MINSFSVTLDMDGLRPKSVTEEKELPVFAAECNQFVSYITHNSYTFTFCFTEF